MRKIAPIFFLLLISCGGDKSTPVPENILTKEEFIPVLVDLQILESHFQRQFSRVDLYRESLDSSSRSVFEAHGITKADFEESLAYYSTLPDTLFLIYEAALDTINIRLDRAQ